MTALLGQDLYLLLECLEKRPLMYIAEENLNHIHNFSTAFLLGRACAGHPDPNEQHFRGFHDWIAEKYGFQSGSVGWPNMILAVVAGYDRESPGEHEFGEARFSRKEHLESVKLFFSLLKEYRDVKHNT